MDIRAVVGSSATSHQQQISATCHSRRVTRRTTRCKKTNMTKNNNAPKKQVTRRWLRSRHLETSRITTVAPYPSPPARPCVLPAWLAPSVWRRLRQPPPSPLLSHSLAQPALVFLWPLQTSASVLGGGAVAATLFVVFSIWCSPIPPHPSCTPKPPALWRGASKLLVCVLGRSM